MAASSAKLVQLDGSEHGNVYWTKLKFFEQHAATMRKHRGRYLCQVLWVLAAEESFGAHAGK